jgi:hypothetical protein
MAFIVRMALLPFWLDVPLMSRCGVVSPHHRTLLSPALQVRPGRGHVGPRPVGDGPVGHPTG